MGLIQFILSKADEAGNLSRDAIKSLDLEPDIKRSLLSDKNAKADGPGIPAAVVAAAAENRSLLRGEAPSTPGPSASQKEWEEWGKSYGVDMSVSKDVPVKTSDGGEVMIPGGLDGEFTIADLFQIKANNFDPNRLDQATHNALMQKFVRTYQPSGEFNTDPVDLYNALNFSLLSPNAPLTPNEFLAMRTRARDMGDLERLAGMSGQEGVAGLIDATTGVGAASRGGMGVKGTADLANQTELARLLIEKPEMFTPYGDETVRDVGFRVMNQVPGLSVKTASLGIPFADLRHANTSAVDLHMIRNNYKRLMQDSPDFAARMESLMKKNPSLSEEDAAISLIGGTHPSLKYRTAKGDLNASVPPYLSPEKLAYEPDKFTTPNQFYEGIMGYVDESRGASPEIELFPEQWRLWDRYRGRVEPHEMAHPDYRKLPRQSFSEMQASLDEHKRLGYTQQNLKDVDDADWRKLYYGKASPGLLAATAAGTGAALAAPALMRDGVFQHSATKDPVVERVAPVRNQSGLLKNITDFNEEVFRSVRHAAGPLAEVFMPYEGVNEYLKIVNDYDRQPTWWDRLGLLDW